MCHVRTLASKSPAMQSLPIFQHDALSETGSDALRHSDKSWAETMVPNNLDLSATEARHLLARKVDTKVRQNSVAIT
jgi:hypothetical protein